MKYYRIVFSPTGGTEKVAKAIMKNWKQIETIDLVASAGNTEVTWNTFPRISISRWLSR